jgi:hypothetical protein
MFPCLHIRNTNNFDWKQDLRSFLIEGASILTSSRVLTFCLPRRCWLQFLPKTDERLVQAIGCHTVSYKGFKQKVITYANDYHRVKGDTLKVQNCHELKSSTLGLLRSWRLSRSNDLETQNDENFRWKFVKTRWNPKFGLSDLKTDLLTSTTSVIFFKNYISKISASSWEKWAIARLSSQTFKISQY